MYYNEDRSQYEAIILLKQGFYNYMYGVKTEEGLMFEPFEASHSWLKIIMRCLSTMQSNVAP